MAERDREGGDGAVVVHETVQPCALVAGLLHGSSDNDEGTGEHLQVLARPPELVEPALDVGVEALPVLERAVRGEDHLGRLRCQLLAGLGRAGLYDHRPALHGPGNIERAAYGEVWAAVVEHMQFLGIEIDAARDVANERVVRPAVPETLDDIDEFTGTVVAVGMLDMGLEPEVERGVRIGCGDDVPARAALAQVIERRKAPRDMVRLVEGRRRCRDEPKPVRDDSECRQQGRRIERRHRRATLQRLERHVQHRQVIGHEEGIEFAPLECLGEAFQVIEVEVGVRKGTGITPRCGVDADGPHERAEMQLLAGH